MNAISKLFQIVCTPAWREMFLFNKREMVREAKDELAAQAAEIAALREALEPFAHPDLCEYLPANKDGGNSPLFQRNKAVITINDCRRAARALKGAKE